MCKVCKRHNSPKRRAAHKVAEVAIDRNEKTIRSLIDELVAGTQQLKSLYGKDDDAR